jgi:cytochrome c
MGELFWNKVAGSVLGTLLVVFGLQEISHMIVHPHELEEAAYPIEVPEEGAGGAVEEAAPDIGALLAAANPTAGGTFARTLCGSCHTFEEGGAALTGPNLYNVVGRPVASFSGFAYSPAMQGHGGDWTYEALWAFLENPQRNVSGTAMTFAGLPREDQRANVIAFLSTLSATPAPFPAPLAAAAPAEEAAAPEAAAPAAPAAEPASPGPIHNTLE